MYEKNVGKGAVRGRGVIARIIRGLTWFAHRSDGALYADDLGPPFVATPRRRTVSRLPHAELSEDERRQAAEEQRRKIHWG